MKKLYYSSFTYLILALASGVIWREITKILDITEKTALNVVHTHLFALGFIMFLVFMVLNHCFHIEQCQRFNTFFILYHVGVGLTALLMFIRGIVSIQEIRGDLVLSSRLDSSISGIAGIGHMILTVALVILMLMLKEKLFEKKKA